MMTLPRTRSLEATSRAAKRAFSYFCFHSPFRASALAKLVFRPSISSAVLPHQKTAPEANAMVKNPSSSLNVSFLLARRRRRLPRVGPPRFLPGFGGYPGILLRRKKALMGIHPPLLESKQRSAFRRWPFSSSEIIWEGRYSPMISPCLLTEIFCVGLVFSESMVYRAQVALKRPAPRRFGTGMFHFKSWHGEPIVDPAAGLLTRRSQRDGFRNR